MFKNYFKKPFVMKFIISDSCGSGGGSLQLWGGGLSQWLGGSLCWEEGVRILVIGEGRQELDIYLP